MMRRLSPAIVAGGLVAISCVSGAARIHPGDDGEVERRIAAIKLTEAQRAWQRIPWITDLAEGRRLAAKEARPIFLWVTGDEPLERC